MKELGLLIFFRKIDMGDREIVECESKGKIRLSFYCVKIDKCLE